jgi:tRNA pseudouridine13 synthase
MARDSLPTSDLPLLTGDLPGLDGRIKQRPEDFRVEEIPLYPISGEGTHLYVCMEKCGLPTPAAVERVARHMGVRADAIGLAGLKDAQAVTSQLLSLEHADTQRLASFRDRQIRLKAVGLHTNKLKPGHLAGNRFTIRIRPGDSPLPANAEDIAAETLAVLQQRGVPNYFGAQRFGRRGDTGVLGRALLQDDLDAFVEMFLGRPDPTDPPDVRAARDAFQVGAFDRALKRWPRTFSDQRRALAAYKKKRRAAQAVAAIDKRMKRLYVSAFQSLIFNDVLARRVETLDVLLPGDIAKKTDTGGLFPVEDLVIEQPRCAAGQISPTGPLPGTQTLLAEGEPGQIEREVLEAYGVTDELFTRGAGRTRGTRRALRFLLGEVSVSMQNDQAGPCLEVCFCAPSGCYATVVIEELFNYRLGA